MKKFSDSVKYIGADDKEIDLFESQYAVPNGISYNSYVILDEKMRSWIRLTFIKRRNGTPIWKGSLRQNAGLSCDLPS